MPGQCTYGCLPHLRQQPLPPSAARLTMLLPSNLPPRLQGHGRAGCHQQDWRDGLRGLQRWPGVLLGRRSAHPHRCYSLPAVHQLRRDYRPAHRWVAVVWASEQLATERPAMLCHCPSAICPPPCSLLCALHVPFPPSGMAACTPCKGGFYPNTARTACDQCAVGTYRTLLSNA